MWQKQIVIKFNCKLLNITNIFSNVDSQNFSSRTFSKLFKVNMVFSLIFYFIQFYTVFH